MIAGTSNFWPKALRAARRLIFYTDRPSCELGYDFKSTYNSHSTDLIKRARELAESSNRLAVEFLVGQIGVRFIQTRNDSYFAEVLDYLCGNLFAYSNMPFEAAGAIAASNVLPHSGGDALFGDAVAEGIALARAQDEAIGRGVPAILLASMPRAASAALTQTLARITRAPILRISAGTFPNYWLIPVWLNRFLRGGAILHDHFGASDFNLNTLREFQVETVNLLVRDPRAAAVSYAKWVYGPQATEDQIFDAYSNCYIPWLHRWISAEKAGKIHIQWFRSDDVTGGPDRLNAIITTLLSAQLHSIKTATLVRANVSGQEPDAWRESVAPELQKRMWELIPATIVDRLELHA